MSGPTSDAAVKPQVQLNPSLSLPHISRVTAAEAMWKQYCRILKPYIDRYPTFPAQLAERDEREISAGHTNLTDYKNVAAQRLFYLKQLDTWPPDLPFDPEAVVVAESPAAMNEAPKAPAPPAKAAATSAAATLAASAPKAAIEAASAPKTAPLSEPRSEAGSAKRVPNHTTRVKPSNQVQEPAEDSISAAIRTFTGLDNFGGDGSSQPVSGNTRSASASAANGSIAKRAIAEKNKPATRSAKRKTSIDDPEAKQRVEEVDSKKRKVAGATAAAIAAASATAAKLSLEPIDYDEAFMNVFDDDGVIQWGFPTYDSCHAPIPPMERDTIGPGIVRTCERCSRKFTVTDEPKADECTYHPGRLQIVRLSGDKAKEYSCCQDRPGAAGCSTGVHVWKEDRLNHLHAAIPFEVSPETAADPKKRLPIIAMDCEMCYTTHGFELCRLTVLDMYGRHVIDELVKPQGQVLDYNTVYSGISSLDDAKFKLEQVRKELFSRIDQDTIIVGHGLDNDFKALRIIHPTIVDTSYVFSHPKGFPSRYSLKYLSSKLLQNFIQNQVEGGHDSAEDARVVTPVARPTELPSNPCTATMEKLRNASESSRRMLERTMKRPARDRRSSERPHSYAGSSSADRDLLAQRLRAKLGSAKGGAAAGPRRRNSLDGVRRAYALGAPLMPWPRRSPSLTSVATARSDGSDSGMSLSSLDALEHAIVEFRGLELVHCERQWDLESLMRYLDQATTVHVTEVLLHEISMRSSGSALADEGAAGGKSSPSASIDSGYGGEEPGPKPLYNTRLFLGALVTSLFPDHVLNQGNFMDDILFDNANALIATFAKLLKRPNKSKIRRFEDAWERFRARFDEWRLASQQILIRDLIDHFLEVDQLWQEVKNGLQLAVDYDPDTEVPPQAYVSSLKARQRLIYDRLRRFGGAEALESLDLWRKEKGLSGFELMDSDVADLLDVSSSGSSSESDGHCEVESESEYDSDDSIQRESLNSNDEDEEHYGNAVIRNVFLFHEIHFGYKHRLPSDYVALAQATMKDAFRVKAMERYKAGKYLPWLPACLRVLSENVSFVTLNPAEMLVHLRSICDIDELEKCMHDGLFVTDRLLVPLRLWLAIMKAICAPVRDAELNRLERQQSPAALLFGLLDVSENMLADFALHSVESLQPIIDDRIVPLERAHFHAMLDAGMVDCSLPGVRRWLTESLDSLTSTGLRPVASQVLDHRCPSYADVLENAFVTAIFTRARYLPETLAMDVSRLRSLHQRSHNLLMAAALVTQLNCRVSEGAQGLLSESAYLLRQGQEGAAGARLFSLIERSSARSDMLAMLQLECPQVDVRKVISRMDPVYKLLQRRLESSLRQALYASFRGTTCEVSKGLTSVQALVQEVAADLCQLVAHNRVVYATWYDCILDDVVPQ